MTFSELKQLAEQGNLILTRNEGNTFTRRKYIYVHKMPSLDTATGYNWDDKINYDEIKEVKIVKYKKYFYFARTKDMPKHHNYKITKNDYQELARTSQK